MKRYPHIFLTLAFLFVLAPLPPCFANAPSADETALLGNVPCDSLTLTSSSDVVAFSWDVNDYVPYLKEYLSGTKLAAGNACAEAVTESRIVLDIDGGLECCPEGFEFAVRPGELRITGRDRAGVFYGIQHLLRQLPPSVYDKQGLSEPVQLPLGVSLDAPESTYRGLMIDVARAFVDAEGLKRQIDLMGMHNLNVLHLHLTDNEGWRLEIKSHPELSEVG